MHTLKHPTSKRKSSKVATESGKSNGPEQPGPYTLAGRIDVAMQGLELLDWALNARLDGASEREAFGAPLWTAMQSLSEVAEHLRAEGARQMASKGGA